MQINSLKYYFITDDVDIRIFRWHPFRQSFLLSLLEIKERFETLAILAKIWNVELYLDVALTLLN